MRLAARFTKVPSDPVNMTWVGSYCQVLGTGDLEVVVVVAFCNFFFKLVREMRVMTNFEDESFVVDHRPHLGPDFKKQIAKCQCQYHFESPVPKSQYSPPKSS